MKREINFSKEFLAKIDSVHDRALKCYDAIPTEAKELVSRTPANVEPAKPKRHRI